jgi:long-subunit fatty acid transport protein
MIVDLSVGARIELFSGRKKIWGFQKGKVWKRKQPPKKTKVGTTYKYNLSIKFLSANFTCVTNL